MRTIGIALCLGAVVGCTRAVSTGTGTGTTTAPTQPATPAQVWPVLTRSHVDLWLHGYAMLLRDTAKTPVFRRGYRDRIQAIKAQRNISTLLDANRERLQTRLSLSPSLANGQFAPLYFRDFAQMQEVIGLFLQVDGNPASTNDPALRQYFAVLASSFGSGADRDFLRTFSESLEDERRRFYQEYWTSEHGSRLNLVRGADSIWQATYRLRLQRFLNNTQQGNGEFILALTLGGEGRTVNFSSRQNAVAVTLPEQDPREAIYVFAHEVVGSIVATAVNDNTTPNDQRAGVSAGYVLTGAVRGGLMLLQRAAPELAAGYTRYYLGQAGLPVTGDIDARLAANFPLPEAIRAAIDRQLEVVLGGI
jgi:hypothetical protein